jgi:predicted RNase H-like nuclease (RuvC/YqgF family)
LAELSTAPAEKLIAELEGERRNLLLDGDDGELAAIEEKIGRANLELERTTARIRELQRRLAQAEIDEGAAKLTDERDAVEAEASAVAAALRDEYPRLVAELVTLLTRLDAAEIAVERLNAKLLQAGRAADTLREVEWRALPKPPGQYAPTHSVRYSTKLAAIPGVTPGFDPGGFPTWSGRVSAAPQAAPASLPPMREAATFSGTKVTRD